MAGRMKRQKTNEKGKKKEGNRGWTLPQSAGKPTPAPLLQNLQGGEPLQH